jgi:hypothetical protein
VCDTAARVFDQEAERLMVAYGLEAPPIIDVESCGAVGIGSEQEGRWLVKFGLAKEIPPYQSAEIFTLILDTTGRVERAAGIRLLEQPWPVG